MFGMGSIVVVVATAAYQIPMSKLEEWWEKFQQYLAGAAHLAAGNVDPAAMAREAGVPAGPAKT